MEEKRGRPLLALSGLCKYYTGATVVMGLNNVELSFYTGEFVAITGESGSGKSTLAHVLSGILPYESGEMLFRGRPTSHFDSGDWERYRRDNISFISQNYGILPGSTVLQNVDCALRLSGLEEGSAKKRAEALLKQVELWELRSRRAGKLSSGQKQRLSIARALAKPAPILIADEPTGNLDPENSTKVIRLLAEAARERLVILITHDFQEAEGCATRRITLQDGRVTMDAALGEPQIPRQQEVSRKRRSLSGYVAGLQLRSRPVWTTLVLLFFALTAFAVFAFLGTFIVNLDDTATRIYDNSAFLNGDKTRIVIQRPDGEPLTEEDMAAILSVKYAESLERSGYVTDVNYAWQEGVDFQYHYAVADLESANANVRTSVELLDTMPFLRTIPMLADGKEFLTAGRLPENLHEVVLAGEGSRIGETMTVYIRDVKTWNQMNRITLEVTIVGVTDYGEGLYFDEELGRVFTNYMMAGGKFGETWMVVPLYQSFFLENEIAQFDPAYAEEQGMLEEMRILAEGECLMGGDMYSWYRQRNSREGKDGQPITLWVKNNNKALRVTNENYGEVANNPEYFAQLEAVGIGGYGFNYMLLVNPETFEELAWAGNSNQVSLYITDYAYTQRVLDTLEELGYTAISPFQQCSTEKDPVLAAERMQTLLVCVCALAAVVLLMVLVLRELFGVQNESYKLLADLGLSCAAAKRSLLWQILLLGAGGQLFGFLAVAFSGGLGVERIVSIMRYLPRPYWLILSAVHLAVTLLAGAWVMSSLQRKVYPISGEAGDLTLEDGEAAL
ncbi:MAG: ABC transporter ATP-binding protein [Oscillospiraceae bacterium]|nr:ABC transporter ATP-binding protein [Oscillospiraceae bacterium]